MPGRDLALQRVEAILLLAREPLNSRKLAQLAQLEDGTRARTLVRKLNEMLDAAGRSFRVEEVAGGYQLLTRHKFAPWLRRLGNVPLEVRLSAVALETLAVVAYRQPVLKADIEAIRGVHCGEVLRQLMERDLVRIGGRSEELGRPYLYATTKRFLQQYGLRSLDELPRAEILRNTGLPPVAKQPANGHHTANQLETSQAVDKEPDVSVTLSLNMNNTEQFDRRYGAAVVPGVRLDDDDDFEDEEVDEDEDDFDDDEDDEDEDEDEDDAEEDDELEEEEWEEVEDEEEDELEEEEEEDDFDDEEDEEWDDEEEDDADDDEDEDEDDDWEEEEEDEAV